MSQVDKLNYIPLLFWFIVLMGLLYIIVFLLFIPLVYIILKTRKNEFDKLCAAIEKNYASTKLAVRLMKNVKLPVDSATKDLSDCALTACKKSIISKVKANFR